MKRFLALFLCALLAAPACATTSGPRFQAAPAANRTSASTDALAEFAKQLPLGARVRARTADRTVQGTLLKVTDTAVFVQPRARVAEPVEEITFTRLVSIEQEVPGGGSNAGRTAAIAAAAAAGATLGVLLILAAIFSD